MNFRNFHCLWESQFCHLLNNFSLNSFTETKRKSQFTTDGCWRRKVNLLTNFFAGDEKSWNDNTKRNEMKDTKEIDLNEDISQFVLLSYTWYLLSRPFKTGSGWKICFHIWSIHVDIKTQPDHALDWHVTSARCRWNSKFLPTRCQAIRSILRLNGAQIYQHPRHSTWTRLTTFISKIFFHFVYLP